MEVQTEITPQDLIDFQRNQLFRASYNRNSILRTFFVIGVLALGPILLSLTSKRPLLILGLLQPLLMFILFYIGAMALQWVYGVPRRIKVALANGKNRTLLGSRKVTLSPQNVTETSEFASYVCSWRAIEKITVSQTAIYIFLSAYSALVVPKRAFADEASFQAFAQTAQSYLAGASDPSPVPIAQP